MIYEVKKVTSIADYFLICTADSPPQIKAIIEDIETVLGKRGVYPLSTEGKDSSQWVLLDYGDVIIHLFRKEARAFYNLDGLWGDSPRIDLEVALVRVKTARGHH